MGAVTRSRVGAAGRIGAAALLLAAQIALAPTAAAAEPSFGTATATAEFLDGITLRQDVTIPAGVVRVEAYVRAGEGDRTFLAEVPSAGQGQRSLQYRYETPPGSVYPNTRIQLGFRLTFEDGRVVDGPPASVLYEDDRIDWRTLQGEVVRIHWSEGDEAFGRRALAIAERGIEEATKLLGVEENEPIDFFIYADRDQFYDVLGPALQENVGGIALAEIRTLFANIAPGGGDDSWVGLVVPHELTHLVFDTATRNPYHEPAHWLNEGLADYLAQGYTPGSRSNVEAAARSGDLMPLRALAFRFPSTPDRFSLGYDESVSAIDYLIRTHGQDALVQLVRSYADGVSDDAAFESALGVTVAEFEAGWFADLGVEEPAPFGPRPAPLGSVPPGWSDAVLPSGPPVASPPPGTGPTRGGGGGGDLASTVVIVGFGVLALAIVGGLVVSMRRMSTGDPIFGASAVPPDGSLPAAEHATDEAPAVAGPDDPAESGPADSPGAGR